MKRVEAQHQSAFIRWVRLQSSAMPALRWIHHVPNGEHRQPRTAARLSAMGVKAGVWDLFWPCPRHGYAGVYIEFKGPKGRLTKEQKEFVQDLGDHYFFVVVNDWKDAVDFACQWLGQDLPATPITFQ